MFELRCYLISSLFWYIFCVFLFSAKDLKMNDIFAVTFIISCWLFLLLLISMLRNITNLNFCMIKRLKNVWQLFYHIRWFLQFQISALKSVTNYLLVNLSVADLLITWLCIPMQVIKKSVYLFRLIIIPNIFTYSFYDILEDDCVKSGLVPLWQSCVPHSQVRRPKMI